MLCSRRTIGWRLLLCAALALASGPAAAQRMLVTTTTLSATREAAGVYVQSVDMRAGCLPGPEHLPGQAPLSSVLLTPGPLPVAFLSTGAPSIGGDRNACDRVSYATVLKVAPFQRIGRTAFVDGWADSLVGMFPGANADETVLVSLGSRQDDQGGWQGRIQTRVASRGQDYTIPRAPEREWVFGGEPVWSTIVPETSRVAVLCRGEQGKGVSLCVVDTGQADSIPLVRGIGEAAGSFGTNPVCVGAPSGSSCFFVLTTGYSLGRPSGDTLLWVHALDGSTLEEWGAPLELPGMATVQDDPLHFVGTDACWVATRSAGADFGYATLLRVSRAGIAQEAQVSVAGTTTAIRLAVAPGGPVAAAAFGNRLERWENGRRTDVAKEYETNVDVVEWSAEGLFVGEAGRLHQVDPATFESLATIQLQSGYITGITPLAGWVIPGPDTDGDGLVDEQETAAGLSPTTADTDGDGVADGADPEASVASPRLDLPALVTFHSRGVGREIKGIVVGSANAHRSTWRLGFDEGSAPWLMVNPRSGPVPYPVYMGVIPSRYRPDEPSFETLTFHLAGIGSGVEAAGSPCPVYVRVVPEERREVRRILWVWACGAQGREAQDQGDSGVSFRDASDPRQLREVAELLAAPPYYFAHREVRGPFDESLAPYSVVVLTAEAAVEGSIAGPALLDYVLEGGALLFLGRYLPTDGDASAVVPWLSAAGIRVDTSVLVEGTFGTPVTRLMCRAWEEGVIEGGCAIYAEDASSILVGGDKEPRQALFAATSYGHGRIALLASATPIESARIAQTPSGRKFAEDLFQWLSGALRDIQEQDTDGDGLPDDLEDRNGNGKRDPGETDYLRVDTDEDGLPDGVEDMNLNGRVDDGETSPLNPDSDGDGILDGADVTPLPSPDAPRIAAVHPPQAPAEGGGRARISGRNFTPDCVVWFGDRPARPSRMLRSTDLTAEIPPSDTVGLVPVRVSDPQSGLEGVLPTGFLYEPRSKVSLVLATLDAFQAQDATYRGSLSLTAETPGDTPINLISVRLAPDPASGFRWLTGASPSTPESIPQQPRSPWPIERITGENSELELRIGGRKGDPAIEGTVAVVPFAFPCEPAQGTVMRIAVKDAKIAARNGQLLDSVSKELVLNVPRAAVRLKQND